MFFGIFDHFKAEDFRLTLTYFYSFKVLVLTYMYPKIRFLVLIPLLKISTQKREREN